MSESILTERDGAVATIVLNNPDKRNALTKASWRKLTDVVGELSRDEGLRCIIVRGAGDKAFAAGADISEFPELRANAVQAKEYGDDNRLALEALRACVHPTIAMIHGACTGGGLEIACCCDIRISGASGRFGVPINRLGHAFAYPELQAVIATVGRAMVLELLLEGRIIDAAEAERRGLVSRVVADEALANEVRVAAERIAAAAPLSNRASKKFVNRLEETTPLSQAEILESYAACDSEDYAEGVQAFLAKRPPVFHGR